MSEKPILFSTEMIRAILDGRKTQTRRVVKPQPEGKFPGNYRRSCIFHRSDGCHVVAEGFGKACEQYIIKPLCQPGNTLWVRETWAKLNNNYTPCNNGSIHVYKADHLTGNDGPHKIKWKPSIHMPRKLARIFLEVKDVRIERLQEITDEDVLSEGFRMNNTAIFIKGYQGAFKILWDSLNAKRGYSWESNPLVWVIEFEKTEVPQ